MADNTAYTLRANAIVLRGIASYGRNVVYAETLGARRRKTRTMKEILLANEKLKRKAHAQIAHLVFANTQANPEKPKELFFSQRSDKNDRRKSNFEN